MNGHHLLPVFFGGAFAANAVPHLVSGLMGHAFQTPFAKPRGQGVSSSTVNMVWGLANLAIAYLLLFRLADFQLRDGTDAAAFGLGVALLGLLMAWHFGRFNGGNRPDHP